MELSLLGLRSTEGNVPTSGRLDVCFEESIKRMQKQCAIQKVCFLVIEKASFLFLVGRMHVVIVEKSYIQPCFKNYVKWCTTPLELLLTTLRWRRPRIYSNLACFCYKSSYSYMTSIFQTLWALKKFWPHYVNIFACDQWKTSYLCHLLIIRPVLLEMLGNFIFKLAQIYIIYTQNSEDFPSNLHRVIGTEDPCKSPL